MKNLMKFLGIFLLSAFMVLSFSSCSDDDDPADNDFFAGTYEGDIGYAASGTVISVPGSVFVTKIASGTKYNFNFSDEDIPDLNGVEFEQQGDNVLVSVGATDLNYVRIDNDELDIAYTMDGKTWTANCTRQ